MSRAHELQTIALAAFSVRQNGQLIAVGLKA
jgi:hypothetical protein